MPLQSQRHGTGGCRYMAYRLTDTLEVVNDEATLQKLFRPGLLGLLLKGEKLTE
jgi:hypothetical protein